ncbi:neutral/alkaline non-lysosomal ceramidase N-terminal domain-containing protein [Bacteriovoracaceae bacterium]|nr:neutral/alkaline non-lysosomal ceramidase N-terminal domain-containing protein [Bacteriovoracaceae bacterium]
MMKIGFGKARITSFIPGAVFFGYGKPSQKAKFVLDELYARTIFFKNDEETLLYVNCELGCITHLLREKVLEKLAQNPTFKTITKKNFILTAQHTHSAPGGMDDHPLYNFPNGGQRKDVLDQVSQGILSSITLAFENIQNGKVYWKHGRFNESAPVAFNRSLKSFLSNKDISTNRDWNERNSVDRMMRMVHIVREKDEGSINWFGVHTTSMSNRNCGISSDNKGHASGLLEKDHQAIAIFAQEKCGDVSPSFRYVRRYRENTGPHNDDISNCHFNGRLQFEKAQDILKKQGNELSSQIRSLHQIKKLSEVKIHPQVREKYKKIGIKINENQTAVKGAMGIDFIKGTKDGQGLHPLLAEPIRLITKMTLKLQMIFNKSFAPETYAYQHSFNLAQSTKSIFLQTGDKKVVGFSSPIILYPIRFFDKIVNTFLIQHFKGELEKSSSWIREDLNFQLSTIGELAIISLPFEITTHAGRRLILQIKEELEKKGIKHFVINTYANGYAGYVTTPEEYDCQAYEGGHTLFGKWTLPAIESIFMKFAKEL